MVLSSDCLRVCSRHQDCASEPLFSSVKPEVFKKTTFKAFAALLDNYVRAARYSHHNLIYKEKSERGCL